MAAVKTFKQEQRGVAFRMAAGRSVTIVVSATCTRWEAAGHSTLTGRLVIAARADVFVLCWLAAAIAHVARLRFFSSNDIAGSGSGTGTSQVSRARTVLQNTLEQVALAIPVHVALAIMVTSSIPLIVALTVLFAIGRLLFWIGYARGARARDFGFALTFYPSVAGLLIALVAAMRLPL